MLPYYSIFLKKTKHYFPVIPSFGLFPAFTLSLTLSINIWHKKVSWSFLQTLYLLLNPQIGFADSKVGSTLGLNMR